jgi:hypothetical protein
MTADEYFAFGEQSPKSMDTKTRIPKKPFPLIPLIGPFR